VQQLNAMEDFHRDISYRLLKKESGTAILAASLLDRFHDIAVQVIVDVTTLAIVSATADFRRSPTVDCGDVCARLSGLAGFVIGRGLQRKIAEVLGGCEGCGNLRHLLLGLLPLALNLNAAAGITDEREMMDAIQDKLTGTCAGYVGPLAAAKKSSDL